MARIGNNVYFRQSTGKWEGRFIKGRRPDGRLWYGYVSGRTEAECTLKRNQAAKIFEKERRYKSIGDRLIFSAVTARWLDSVSKTKKDSTICKYRNTLKNHLNPRFGNRKFTEIMREDVMDYIMELQTKGGDKGHMMSSNTVKGIISVLRAVLEYGGLQYHMPVADLSRLSIGGKEKARLRVLTENETNRLLDYILSDFNSRGLGILLVLYTGLRLGELCALRWEDINFREGTLTVHSTMKRIQMTDCPEHKTKVVITPPKSPRSQRTIPLHGDILETLRNQAGEKGAFFLTGKENSFVEPRTMQNHFKTIVKAVNIAGVTFHTLRHTFATRSIENGVDAKILSEFLGHASVKLTLDRYVHPSEKQKRKNMDKLPGFRQKIDNTD